MTPEASIFEQAKKEQNTAKNLIAQFGIVEAWNSIGATVNLVGSLRTGLLIKNRDIDFHIYTDPFRLADSFSAMAQIAENKNTRRISYSNLIETDEKCIEWHAWIADKDGNEWQVDMIHILPDSPYVGHFENIADRLNEKLSQQQRRNILEIKNSVPDGGKISGAEIYKAVLEDGIETYDQMLEWKQSHHYPGIISLNI